MDGSVDQAPVGAYAPDESLMQALFARPARQATPERETFVAGHAFNGIDREEADRLRWVNLHRRPARVKDHKEVMSARTVVWGTCADCAGIVVNHTDRTEALAGGSIRVERRTRLSHEPASAYARVHPAPMPLRWGHDEVLGEIVALRRAHGNLYAVGETPLTPDELAALAGKDGLRWSTGTDIRIGDPLRIVEISLTHQAATNGLPPVSWHRVGVSKGNVPLWVASELERASSREHRSRGALLVHDLGSEIGYRGELRGFEHRIGTGYERPEIEIRPGGRILSVNGRPVR